MIAIYTVGHSTREARELVDLLEENRIDLLVDVRRYPTSKRHPWFNREVVEETLHEAGIGYRHEERLGGHRHDPDPDSPNTGWRSAGFQAYGRPQGLPRGAASPGSTSPGSMRVLKRPMREDPGRDPLDLSGPFYSSRAMATAEAGHASRNSTLRWTSGEASERSMRRNPYRRKYSSAVVVRR